MGHYKANLRDLEFNLFEVFGRDQVLGTGPYADVDVDTAKAVLAEVRALAEGPLADSFADADRNPPVFDPDTNQVTLPESFKKSYRALRAAEWWRLETVPELGGQLVPRALVWAVLDRASRGWRGVVMTPAAVRHLQEIRRQLLDPPAIDSNDNTVTVEAVTAAA